TPTRRRGDGMRRVEPQRAGLDPAGPPLLPSVESDPQSSGSAVAPWTSCAVTLGVGSRWPWWASRCAPGLDDGGLKARKPREELWRDAFRRAGGPGLSWRS